MNNLTLFEDDWGVNTDPVDRTEIVTTILYYEKDELRAFKKLCRTGMKRMYGAEAKEKNVPDFLLDLLKTHYNDENL